MRPPGPTFFLLDGRTGWRTGAAARVSAGASLALVADAAGPLGLGSDDGSLGGLVLPRGFALGEDLTPYLLGRARPGVRRFDAGRREFVALAAVGEEEGGEVRQFRDPANIAVAGHNLYVADRGNRRVQVFALGTLAVRHVWAARDAGGRRVRPDDPEAWEPVDVAAHAGRAYVLDARHGRVFEHRPGTDALELLIDEPAPVPRWSRLALDREGRVYLFDAEGPSLDVFDREGRRLETKTDASDVADRFDPPPVRLSRRGANAPWRFCLPESLMHACDRRAPAATPTAAAPLGTCAARPAGGLVFDREGKRLRASEEPHTGPKLYATEGTWLSGALDSQVYRCQWHRVELDLSELPAGTRVELRTYTDAQALTMEEVEARPASLWSEPFVVTGQLARPQGAGRGAKGKGAKGKHDPGAHEFLVQSGEGQYLWLKLTLAGDGYGTPRVGSARVHYPRESYVAHLPAVYSSDEESRRFLERFLSIFQTEWDDLERRIDEVAALFDVDSVPAGAPLEWLASWFALPLEGTWDGEQKRRLLAAVTLVYFGRWKVSGEGDACLTEVDPAGAARRGTREGLRRYLRAYLHNITGLDPAQQGDYPQIVEGFRERQRLLVGCGGAGALSHGAPLWGPSQVGRFQFGEFAREGAARLVSTGDPERDLFHEFAHRFRVFVPAAWIPTRAAEEMVRRAVNSEKPGHTAFDLCLVEPRMRVGVQSTVGVDTILGALPAARLACTHEQDAPPSRAPRHRLGYDTVLSAPAGDRPTFRLGPETRAGVGAILT